MSILYIKKILKNISIMFFILLIKYMYDGTIIGVKSMYASQIESNKKNNISINKVIYRE